MTTFGVVGSYAGFYFVSEPHHKHRSHYNDCLI